MHPMITSSSSRYTATGSVATKFIPLIFLLVFSLDGPRAKPFDNVGKSDFYQLVMHDGVFVDRSLFIDEYLRRSRAKILILRPKLFGKSLTLDMLRRFLEIEVDANGQRIPETERINRALFNGTGSSRPLRIANSTATMQCQGEVPVVFVSFKNLTGSTYREFESSVNEYVTDLFANKYRYLRDNLTTNDQDVFDMFAAGNATTPDLETSLRFLTKRVQKHFGNRKVHLLVDDYDTPFGDMMYETVIHRKRPVNGTGEKVAKADDLVSGSPGGDNGTSENGTVADNVTSENGTAAGNATSENKTTAGNATEEISDDETGTSEKDFLKEGDFGRSVRLVAKMLANALRNNPAVEQSLIMGRLPLSRTDMGVELERLVREYSLMNKPFSEFFGFFEGEVNQLKSKLAPEASNRELKRWYKGYQFADNVVYNPYSVMRCLQRGGRCDDYWARTNDTKLVDHLFRNQELFDEVCELLGNETVEFHNTKFSFVDVVRGDLFRYLLFAGYVSPLWRGVKKKPITLKIPNYEIRRSYRGKVIDWATDKFRLTEAERRNATDVLGDDVNTSQLRFWLRSRLHR